MLSQIILKPNTHHFGPFLNNIEFKIMIYEKNSKYCTTIDLLDYYSIEFFKRLDKYGRFITVYEVISYKRLLYLLETLFPEYYELDR